MSPQGHRRLAPILVQAVTISLLCLQWPPDLPVSLLVTSHSQHPDSFYWDMAVMMLFLFPNPLWLPNRLGIQCSLFAVMDEPGSICPVNLSKATFNLPFAPLLLQPSWTSQRSGNTPSSALPQGLGTSCSCALFRSPELSLPQCDPDRHVYLKCQPTLTHGPLTHHTVSLWDLRSAFLLLQALPTDRMP